MTWGSGCGSVGRTVASNTRYPQFEYSHWLILSTIKCIEKMKLKEKRPGMADFLKKEYKLTPIDINLPG